MKSKMTPEEFLRIRKKLGMSQTQMGRKLMFGAPQPRVSEIERGVVEITPRIEKLLKYIEEDIQKNGRETHS